IAQRCYAQEFCIGRFFPISMDTTKIIGSWVFNPPAILYLQFIPALQINPRIGPIGNQDLHLQLYIAMFPLGQKMVFLGKAVIVEQNTRSWLNMNRMYGFFGFFLFAFFLFG